MHGLVQSHAQTASALDRPHNQKKVELKSEYCQTAYLEQRWSYRLRVAYREPDPIALQSLLTSAHA